MNKNTERLILEILDKPEELLGVAFGGFMSGVREGLGKDPYQKFMTYFFFWGFIILIALSLWQITCVVITLLYVGLLINLLWDNEMVRGFWGLFAICGGAVNLIEFLVWGTHHTNVGWYPYIWTWHSIGELYDWLMHFKPMIEHLMNG